MTGKELRNLQESYMEMYNPERIDEGRSTHGSRVGFKKQSEGERQGYDIYDVVLSHLLDEGYAETQEAAEAIMVNMSEEWIDSIVDEVITEGEKPFPYEKVTAQQKKHTAAGKYRNMIWMGLAKRRAKAKEADKRGGSQQDAGKG